MHHPENGIDLSAQVALVKRKARPWKAIIALVLAIAAAVVSHESRFDYTHPGFHSLYSASPRTYDLIDYGAALLVRNQMSPALLAEALETIAKAHSEAASAGGYLSSHPATAARLKRLRDLAASVEAK